MIQSKRHFCTESHYIAFRCYEILGLTLFYFLVPMLGYVDLYVLLSG